MVKESARAIAVDALTGQDWGRTVRAVRVNGLETPWCYGDIVEIVTGARDALDVLIVPKARSARDVWWFDVLLTQLEAKLGLTQADRAGGAHRGGRGPGQRGRDRPVQRSARGDHLRRRRPLRVAARPGGRELRSRRDYPGDFWHFARVQILAAARAAGIDAIDAPYPAYQDPDGYRRAADARQPAGLRRQVGHPPRPGADRQ